MPDAEHDYAEVADLRRGPLTGYRILEFGANFTAPIATMLLGDQGADVIKVENGTGDQMRYAGAYRGGVQGLASVFLSANRNKRSITLDLKAAESVAMVRRLIAVCDVVVQNFRPGVIDRLGFGFTDCKQIRDDIIYVTIDGLGAVGPERKRRVYDTVVQGISGMAGVQRDVDTHEPRAFQTAIADKITALTVFQAITAALLARERSGDGQHVRVSMLDAAISFLWPDSMGNNTLVGEDVTKLGTAMDTKLIYRTKDDFILATCMSNADWIALATVIGRPELVEDSRFVNITDRIKNTASLYGELQNVFLTRTTAEWIDLLRTADAVFAPVNRPETLHLDAQVQATGAIRELEHPQAGAYRQPVHPIRFEGTPAGLWRQAPSLGEHSAEIIEEFGLGLRSPVSAR